MLNGGKKSRTIKGKITLQTAIYLMIAIVVCEMVSVDTLWTNMTSQAKSYVSAEAESNASIVNEWLTEQANIVRRLCNSAAFMNRNDTDQIMDWLETNLGDNPDALMYYVCFGYDGGVFPADHSTLDLDPTTRDWWTQALEKNGLIFTAPYKDFATGQMVVSIAQPVTMGGEQAVFLADIKLDTLTALVDNVSDDENIQAFLLDAEGNVIAHENEDFLPKEDGNTVLSETLGVDLDAVSEIKDYDGNREIYQHIGHRGNGLDIRCYGAQIRRYHTDYAKRGDGGCHRTCNAGGDDDPDVLQYQKELKADGKYEGVYQGKSNRYSKLQGAER